MTNEYGYLELIIGPMFAGKTTMLINTAQKVPLDKSIRIAHSINTRDLDSSGKAIYRAHDGKVLGDVVPLSELNQIFNLKNYKKSTVIFIEELQFFADAYNTVRLIVERDNKSVYAYGLDGTFMREPFGDVLKLIPFANEVRKLNALCAVDGCKQDAPFTRKFASKKTKKYGSSSADSSGADSSSADNVIEVGGKDIYQPVCRKHFK